jgi:hypothetical protein
MCGADETPDPTIPRVRLIARAARLRSVRSARPKALWLAGLGWETPPQNPRGVSPAKQARFLTEALWLADHAGAEVVAWNGLQDRVTHLPGFPSVASGLFFNYENDLARDAAKPALGAYRFPFLVRASKRGARAWGVAPRPRVALAVERRGPRGWRRVTVAKASRSGEFSVRVGGEPGLYRARQGQAQSLLWRL